MGICLFSQTFARGGDPFGPLFFHRSINTFAWQEL
jgi:hypothetical protein